MKTVLQSKTWNLTVWGRTDVHCERRALAVGTVRLTADLRKYAGETWLRERVRVERCWMLESGLAYSERIAKWSG